MPLVYSVPGLQYRIRSAAADEVCWPRISPLCLVTEPASEDSLGQEEKIMGPWEGLRTGVELAKNIAEKELDSGVV